MSSNVITTPRLRLRPYTPLDLKAAADLWSDLSTAGSVTGLPANREEVWNILLRYTGSWAWFGYGYWAVEDLESGIIIGEVGIDNFNRNMDFDSEGKLELGYAITPAAQRQGYGKEAVGAAIAWADEHLEESLFALILPTNYASVRLATGHGFEFRGETKYGAEVFSVYIRDRNSI